MSAAVPGLRTKRWPSLPVCLTTACSQPGIVAVGASRLLPNTAVRASPAGANYRT